MDTVASRRPDQADPRTAAVCLQKDFEKLVLLFKRELSKKTDPVSKPHLAQAKDAAERGLELSRQLAGLLAKAD